MKKRGILNHKGYINRHPTRHKFHPIFSEKLTLGQRAADKITIIGGSWLFIIILLVALVIWIIINSILLIKKPFDPYPYILLNLFLSSLAAIQAPIILMSQNRQAQRDRIDAKYDHAVNRKAEREIQRLQYELERVRKSMKKNK